MAAVCTFFVFFWLFAGMCAGVVQASDARKKGLPVPKDDLEKLSDYLDRH